MKNFILISIFLLLVCSLTGDLLFTTVETNNFMIFILLLLLTIRFFSFNLIKSLSIKKFLFCILIIFFLSVVLLFVKVPLKFHYFFTVAAYLYLLKIFVKDGLRYEKRIISIFLLTLFFYLNFVLIYLFVPTVWLGLQAYAQFISENVASLAGKKALFGATTLGMTTTILFIIFLIVYHFSLKNKSVTRLILSLVSLFIAQLLSVPIQISVVGLIKKFNHSLFITPMDVIFVPVMLSLIPVYFFTQQKDIKGISTQYGNAKLKYFIAGLVLFFTAANLLTLPDLNQRDKSSQTIFLYSKGVVTWNKPEFGRYGIRSSGMFGMLPDYLESFGYSVTVDSTINKTILEKAKALVVINLNQNFSVQEKEAIRQFVKQGGSLLVLGDHTGLAGIREPLNDLLKFIGIEFNFDSAHYLKEDWGHSFEFSPHQITRNLKTNYEVGISVGASLNLKNKNAIPIIIAKFGFSDWGNALNKDNAFLGDRRYNEGELLGDIILVAQATYGKGKVLVFGDTSSFQNGVLERNFQFIDHIFDWLTDQSTCSYKGINKILGVIFLIIGLLILIVLDRSNLDDLKILFLFSVMLIALMITNTISAKNINENIPNGNIVYIDQAHLERFEIYGEDGIWSLSYNLMRNGYLPFLYKEFSEEALKKSKLFFAIAPAKTFSDTEIKTIDNYIKNGGIVFWSVGYEEKLASTKFLSKYGLDLDNVPLGSVPKEQTDQKIRFVEAWPIIYNDKSNIQVLCTAWDFPTIVSKNIGKGKLILIADSYFLLSRNLEQYNSYYEENILFLKSLLDGISSPTNDL